MLGSLLTRATANLSPADGVPAASPQLMASLLITPKRPPLGKHTPQAFAEVFREEHQEVLLNADYEAPTAAKFSSKRAGGTTFQSMLSPAFHQHARSNVSKQI